jgi:hypothetical protein
VIGCLAVATVVFAGQFDVNAAVTSEARAGQAPIVAGYAPQNSVAEVVTPAAMAEYLAPGAEVRLGYSLRVFARQTEGEQGESPVLLHTGTLDASDRLTQRLTLRAGAVVSEGAADYSYLPTIFGAGQAQLVVVPRIFSLDGHVELDGRATRTLTLNLVVSALHFEALSGGTPPPPPPGTTTTVTTGAVLPNTTALTVSPGAKLRLSLVDELLFTSAFELGEVSGLAPSMAGGPSNTLSSFVVMPTIGWRRYLARRTELDLKLGLAVAHVASSISGDLTRESPVGGIALDSRLYARREAILSTQLSAELEYYLDPILGIVESRGLTTAGLSLVLPSEWEIVSRGSFSTTFAAHPRPGPTPNDPPTYPDEVGAGAEVFARHRLGQNFAFEFGGRWSDRTPYFTAPNYGFHQRQLWLYVSLRGTTKPIPRAPAF